MSTPPKPIASLRHRLSEDPAAYQRFLWGASASVCLEDLAAGSSLGGRAPELAGRSVLVSTSDPFAAALAFVELDGVARRLIVCTPDLPPEHLRGVAAHADADAIVSDGDGVDEGLDIALRVRIGVHSAVRGPHSAVHIPTEWILLTSGTTGAPKLVSHTLSSLTAAIGDRAQRADVVWGTFYDIRRYGGLQIFFRALLGRRSFVISAAGEPIGAYLLRLATRGATHVSGTPTHWRRALMRPEARAIAPRYVRLSGEIADQGILHALASFYPHAGVGHAFASTEAGVAFEVDDGLEGFPSTIPGTNGDVEVRVDGGALRIRSTRTAARYIGADRATLADADGFVDTGDMVERRGDRYYFLGRKNGTINVGGLKVYPEEVEAAINRHPAVRMSLVRSAKSSITGSLVAAYVVLNEASDPSGSTAAADVRSEIRQICRGSLAAHKIPATIRFVPSLDVAAAGKLARHA